MTDGTVTHDEHADSHRLVLQRVQPALLGLMDGSVSTLAPLFAAAELTHRPLAAFYVGLAASLGAGVRRAGQGRSRRLAEVSRRPVLPRRQLGRARRAW